MQPETLTTIVLVLVMVLGVYFLLIRPQRRATQKQQDRMKNLAPAAKVVTTSGIFGVITAVEDATVQLEVSPGSYLTVMKQAVADIDPAQFPAHLLQDSETPAPEIIDESVSVDSAQSPSAETSPESLISRPEEQTTTH